MLAEFLSSPHPPPLHPPLPIPFLLLPIFFLLFIEESHLTGSLLFWFLLSATESQTGRKNPAFSPGLAINFHHTPSITTRWVAFCVLCAVFSVAQSCPALCNPMDCSPPGSSVHGISQARILYWVAIPFSRGTSWPRDRIQVSCIARRFFTLWATWQAQRDAH